MNTTFFKPWRGHGHDFFSKNVAWTWTWTRCETGVHRTLAEVTFFLGDPFLKFVFCNCDTTDFQTNRFTILPTRMHNALCWPFSRFISLAPLVAIFIIFGLYYMPLSLEEIDVLPMIQLQSFAVFANFSLQPLFYNLILKFPSPRTRTFHTRNADVELRGRTETRTPGLPRDVDLVSDPGEA